MTAVVRSVAKLSYAASHPPVQFPGLSEETWAAILRMACGIGQLEDAPKLLSFPKSPPPNFCARTWYILLHKDSRKLFLTPTLQKHQRRVILVCKAWYRIARPFLYEEIAVLDPSKLRNLLDILNQTSLGSYTKRFDVFFPRSSQRSGDQDRYVEEFIAILRLLPNLRVLTYGPEYSVLPNPASLRTEISRLPNLKVLSTPGFFSNAWDDNSAFAVNRSLRTATFPIIPYPHKLRIEATLNRILPNLSQIWVGDSPSAFQALGVSGSLLSLGVSGVPSVTSLFISKGAGDNLRKLPYFYTLFPRLQYIGLQTTFQVFITEEKWLRETRDFRITLPDTVHTFGISFDGRRAKYSLYRQVCDALDRMKADGLKVIRFEEKTAEDILSKSSVSVLLNELCQKKGWRMKAGDMYV
ncbi:hypothetical protein GYMLUDRAFT_262250 [Collybiopsis luxurians FD-317 M1]|uniref:Unplaced genomic scaffold GYMLUscaffold_33, whole genome shotgun sequence n=1 Tax=Collybiopsis luxurians FD-317 M1 TaxID=944289 RepID=A0A0D0CTS8_9AGAR|nr:hypothetical protein GYMLUDRAFT_262250 [Collybiopsis luxurians FD-317 M1]